MEKKFLEELLAIVNTNRDVDWFENDAAEEFEYLSKLIADKLKGNSDELG
jgi:hypothetical protein